MQVTQNPANVDYVTLGLFIYLSMTKMGRKAIVK